MYFRFLGETYETNNFTPNQPRKLFSAATRITPTTDTKIYTLYIYTYEEGNELKHSSAFSTSKYYMSKFTDITMHKRIQKLTRNQCIYLTKIILEADDFRQAIVLTSKEIQTITKIP